MAVKKAAPKKRAYSTTKVPVERSRSEVEKLLTDAGVRKMRATVDYDEHALLLEFVWPGRNGLQLPVRVHFPLDADEKESRRKMRVALNWMKNRIEAILDGFRSPEEEFLGEIVTPRGNTVFEEIAPQIAKGTGDLKLLPARATNPQILRGDS